MVRRFRRPVNMRQEVPLLGHTHCSKSTLQGRTLQV